VSAQKDSLGVKLLHRSTREATGVDATALRHIHVMLQCNSRCNTADIQPMKQFDVRFEGGPKSDEAEAFARSRIAQFKNDWSAVSGWSVTLRREKREGDEFFAVRLNFTFLGHEVAILRSGTGGVQEVLEAAFEGARCQIEQMDRSESPKRPERLRPQWGASR
jgi:hypothetical protein